MRFGTFGMWRTARGCCGGGKSIVVLKCKCFNCSQNVVFLPHFLGFLFGTYRILSKFTHTVFYVRLSNEVIILYFTSFYEFGTQNVAFIFSVKNTIVYSHIHEAAP
jgi:hypothetical protein